MRKTCGEPLCRYEQGYNYRNIQIDITTHISFLVNRINEAAARAMWALVEWKNIDASEHELENWHRLYSHYLEILGRDPLPDGYSVRLLAEGGDDQ